MNYHPATPVSTYSPDGNCQHQLANLASVAQNENFAFSAFVLLNRQILTCGAYNSYRCYLYDVVSNTWSIYSNTPYRHATMRNVVHQGKIYLTDLANPQVFDPATKAWTKWAVSPSPPNGACFVSWKNYILQFGSTSLPYASQIWKYDPTINAWSTVPIAAKFPMTTSGCVVLPNGNVLIVGSGYYATLSNMYTEYNVTSNSWSPYVYGKIPQTYSLPLLLGNRVFVLAGSNFVEEYVIANSSVTNSSYPYPFLPNPVPSATAVPALWFSHLPGGCKGVY